MPKHGVRCRSCTSQPAIPDVVTRDGLRLYNRGGPLVNDRFWCSVVDQKALSLAAVGF